MVRRAARWPRENKAGMSGSPCSPPSAWEIMCASPVALCQMYWDGAP